MKLLFGLYQDKEDFSKLLEKTEDWLYEDGEDVAKNVYQDKLASLKVSSY